MSQKRERLSGAKKIAIGKRRLGERITISDLCDQPGLKPSEIYRWQTAILAHGADVIDLMRGRQAKAAESAKDATIARFEAVVAEKGAEIAQENGVISELTEANVLAKKVIGEFLNDAQFAPINAAKRSTSSASRRSAPTLRQSSSLLE